MRGGAEGLLGAGVLTGLCGGWGAGGGKRDPQRQEKEGKNWEEGLAD